MKIIFFLLCVFCLFSSAKLISVTDLREKLSRSYLEEARLQAVDGDARSLPFYRAAVRLNPLDETSRIELARAEMSVGSYRKAERHLMKILERNVEHAEAIDMMNRLHAAVGHSLLEDSVDIFFSHIKNCDTYPILELKESVLVSCGENCIRIEGIDSYKDRPFVIRNALSKLARNNTFAIDHLQELITFYGNEVVDFYPHNLIAKPGTKDAGTGGFKSTLNESVNFFDLPEGAYLSVDISDQGSYIQWSPNTTVFQDIMRDKFQITIPEEFKINFKTISKALQISVPDLQRVCSEMKWDMIFVGEIGSGMYNHQDIAPVGSWQLLLSGEKRFIFSSPERDEENSSQCTFCVVEDGDLIFYPAGYFHQTLNSAQALTVAISSTVIHDPPPHVTFKNYVQQNLLFELDSSVYF